MKKRFIVTAPVIVALALGQAAAACQEPQTPAQPPKATRPAPKTFADTIKRNLRNVGASVDEGRSSADMVVSNYSDPKGGKTTIVVVNDRRKGMVGFYIYNFGSLKNATNREEVYRYLLSANDAITIGSFFVDGDEDIGYKYLVSNTPTLSQVEFEMIYLAMAVVARERRAEIRQLLGLSTGKDTDKQ